MNTQEAIAVFDQVSAQVVANFEALTEDQLNLKPAPNKWSIAQCLDHMVVSNRTYYPQLQVVANGSHKNSWYQNIGFISGFMGKWLANAVSPELNTTMKSPPVFVPSSSHLPHTVVKDFLTHQEEMKDWFRKMSKADLDNTILSSPALGAITYSLSDLLLVLANHEQRHLKQALAVLEATR